MEGYKSYGSIPMVDVYVSREGGIESFEIPKYHTYPARSFNEGQDDDIDESKLVLALND